MTDALKFELVAELTGEAGPERRRCAVDFTGTALLAEQPEPGKTRVLRWNRVTWEPVLEADWGDGDAAVQALPGARVLLVSAVSRRRAGGSGEPNAAVFDPDSSTPRLTFSAGDGVDDVQATAAGEVWVAYTFQGSMGDYGRHGWGRIDARQWIEPIGGPGLVRFGLDGSASYAYQPPAGLEPIMDCYALNVSEGETWASYHPGFPLVRILPEGRVDAWRSGLWGIDALAVAGTRFLVHRVAGPDGGWVRGRLEEGQAVDLERVAVQLGTGQERLEAVVGRGSAMHIFTPRGWYRLDLAETS